MRSIIEELEDWKHLHFPVAADAPMNEDKDDDGEGFDRADAEV